jgi:hypothetical protein
MNPLPKKGDVVKLKFSDELQRVVDVPFADRLDIVPITSTNSKGIGVPLDWVERIQFAAKIVYWHDRRTRSWVVQAIDFGGNQIKDADYSGDKKGRDFALTAFQKQHNCTVVERLKQHYELKSNIRGAS